MELKDCVALVTGANRGIGEAFVRVLLAERGAAKVYAGSRDPAAAAHLEREFPGRCIAIGLDVTDPAGVAAAAERCGDVSLLVNNAGLFTNELLIGAADMSHARAEMEVNFFGPLAMTRAFAPVLKRNGGGCVLNVLSAAAIVALPNMGGYSPCRAQHRRARHRPDGRGGARLAAARPQGPREAAREDALRDQHQHRSLNAAVRTARDAR